MTSRMHPAPTPTDRFARTAAEQMRCRREHHALVVRRRRYRRAQILAEDLTEQLGQLSTDAAGPNERLELQENARRLVGSILRFLATSIGTAPVVRRTSSDPQELDEWVQLLDELLTDAQLGYDGAHDRALALAASIAIGVDRLAEESEPSRGGSRAG
jgi:hypothetical protein